VVALSGQPCGLKVLGRRRFANTLLMPAWFEWYRLVTHNTEQDLLRHLSYRTHFTPGVRLAATTFVLSVSVCTSIHSFPRSRLLTEKMSREFSH